ncbi:MAG: Ig-like domain-containing protein [Vicinamibacterales bacterium]
MSRVVNGRGVAGAMVALALASALMPSTAWAQAASGPLRVHPTNPRYFADASGRAVLLAGAHTWYVFQDSGWTDPPRVFDYLGFLDSLHARGDNFIRLFVWEQTNGSVDFTTPYFYAPSAYVRTGPGNALDGKPKFNVSQFNQSYFDRLRQRVQDAGARGIYVSVQLFDGFSVEGKPFRAGNSPWPGHPFNASNNVNGIDGDPNHDGHGREIQTLAIPAVTALQEAYVRKIIDTVGDLDNVLYEICNEANDGSQDWQYHFIQFIKSYEAGKAKQHPVGMTVEWPNGDNAELFAGPADWISPNGSGGYFDNPPSATGAKVIVNDTDHLCYPCGDTPFVWRTVLRGMNPAFMDPYDCNSDVESTCNPNDPIWVTLRANLGYARALAARMNLAAMTPQNTLCSTAYCLANAASTGAEYLVYAPSGGAFTLNLGATTRTLSVEWLNPASGQYTAGAAQVGGATRTFTPPFSGQAVLHVWDAGQVDTTPPTIASVTALSATQVQVVFSEPVEQASAASAANYLVSGSVAVTAASLGADTRTVTLTVAALVTGTFTLTVSNVRDRAAPPNTIAPNSQATFSYTAADVTPPTISTASAVAATQVRVVFSEPVEQASATSVANYTVSGGVTVSAASLGADTRTVTLTVSTLVTGVYTLTVSNVRDRATPPNTITAGAQATFSFTASDTTPPSLVSVTATSATQVQVVFSEPVDLATSTAPASYTVGGGITVTGASLGADTRTVTLTVTTLGTGTYTLTVNNVRDRATPPNTIAANTQATFSYAAVDLTPPTIVSGTATTATRISVVFSEPVEASSAASAGNYGLSGGAAVGAASLGADTRTVTLTVSTLASGVAYTLTVNNVRDRAPAPNTISPNTRVTVTLAAAALPAPWLHADIGAVGQPGGAAYVNGTFFVTGSGADIWGPADAFHMVYRTANGNLDVTALVTSLQSTDPWAKAGVMIRASTSPDAPAAAVVVTPGNGVSFQWRTAAGAQTAFVASSEVAPLWVKVQRKGNTVSGFKSRDGVNWTLVGSVSMSLGTTLVVGLPVTAHNDALLNTASFTSVDVGPADTKAPSTPRNVRVGQQ